MKPLRLVILLPLFAGLGCAVPNDSSIRFLNAHQFSLGSTGTAACTTQPIAIYRGTLDLAGNDRYYVAFDWESNLQAITTVLSTQETIAGPQRNEFVLDHFVFTYSSTPSLPFPTEQVNAYAVNMIGASGASNWLGISLLTPQARQLLRDSLQPGDFAGVELQVTFQAFGSLASGQKLSSNKVTYPIQVFRSSFSSCRVAGDVRAPTGPCGTPGGQDGTVVACCRDITPTPAGCPP
jgi:hypothetical protein